jgi:MSHA biogenesis protein MshM
MKKADRGAENAQVTYADRFGMTEKPFGFTPDPDFFFDSRGHAEALRRLKAFAEKESGIALVYGDVGTGKTLVCRRLLNDLDKSGFHTALIINPLMDVEDFLLDVAGQFNISLPPLSTRDALLAAIADFVEEERKEGKMCVLAVDEAQLLPDETLAMLTGLATSPGAQDGIAGDESTPFEGTALRTILFAQQEIAPRFLDKNMEDLRRRITITHYLHPLSREEVGQYVKFRLSKAGANGSVSFTNESLGRIHTASKGYPRIVNGICDQSLFLLSRGSKKAVDREVLNRVLNNELAIPSAGSAPSGSIASALRRLALILAAFLVICGGLFCYF